MAKIDNNQELFYTLPEAAKVMRVSKNTIYRLIKRGALRAVKISERRVVVPVSVVKRLAEAGKKEETGKENPADAQNTRVDDNDV